MAWMETSSDRRAFTYAADASKSPSTTDSQRWHACRSIRASSIFLNELLKCTHVCRCDCCSSVRRRAAMLCPSPATDTDRHRPVLL